MGLADSNTIDKEQQKGSTLWTSEATFPSSIKPQMASESSTRSR